MKILWGDESIFKDESVFDPEYLPEVLLHRDRQLDSIAVNLRLAVKGKSPIHTICVGNCHRRFTGYDGYSQGYKRYVRR